ncbi:hypothetical protein [Nesterenkonia sandarakina]|uniref:Uncharacterized protein n=1 Tax=Nesterenkonia sandarakina TaxID=272918 RepID=A0A2T0YAF4_9MICC|nr:hypothetical protein [Nesterenkonia sandarakina]PRZ11669.1 hypothetical protein BCL67_1377 [Nesterenkonia sandarakina]
MVISEELEARLQRYSESFTNDDVVRLHERTPQDWNRAGIEAMAKQLDDARVINSRGVLRFHGTGVDGHRASLSSIGLIADAWQRSVTAVGAAMEGVKSARGQVPGIITARTALMLEAAPVPGSVLFNIVPRGDALEEIEPDGDRPLADEWRERPLVDRASEKVVSLLTDMTHVELDATDQLAHALGDLGARVGASLSHLAGSIAKSGIALDSAWQEPEHETVRSRVTPEQARWISDFISQRKLYREEETVTGYLRTISFDDKWRIVLDDGKELRLDASDVPESVAKQQNLDNRVAMTVEITHSIRSDGGQSSAHKLLHVEPAPASAEESTES